jgi:hypothetical protein
VKGLNAYGIDYMHTQVSDWTTVNTLVDQSSWPGGFAITDTVYTNHDISVQMYVTTDYHDIFTKLTPMMDVSVTVDEDSCNWMVSELMAMDIMATLTGDLVDYYEDEIDSWKTYLKANETEYSKNTASLQSQVSKYETLVESYRD